MPSTQGEYNPFDPYAEDELLKRKRTPGYIPSPVTGVAPVTGATTTDTGIPASPAYVPPEEGGFTGNQEPGPRTRIPRAPVAAPTAPPVATAPPTTPTAPAATAATPALAGWDPTKWANPEHNTIKYQAGRIMSQFDPTAIRQNPLPLLTALRAAGINATMVGDDRIDFGDGYGPIDVITQQGTWAWMPDNDLGGTGTGSAISTAAQPMGWGGQTGGSQQRTDPAYNEAIRKMVLDLMRQKPVDMNDPVYAGAMSAYGQQQQRAKERNRNAIAERSAAEGTLNTGGFSDRILGAEQAQGEAEATFAGNLAVRELERQRDEIMQALTIGAGLMTEADRLALQEKLGMINASLQQQSITNQNTQFNQGLGWQQDMFEYGANQGWWQ